MHVTVRVQALGNVSQIFGIGYVQANELGSRMAAHHIAAGFLKFQVGGKIFSVKRPVGVGMQFFPAFVEAVDGEKKSFGVRGVNSNRHVQRAGRFPHRIEPRIVDTN